MLLADSLNQGLYKEREDGIGLQIHFNNSGPSSGSLSITYQDKH